MISVSYTHLDVYKRQVQHIEVVIHIRQETQRLAVLELRDEKILRI